MAVILCYIQAVFAPALVRRTSARSGSFILVGLGGRRIRHREREEVGLHARGRGRGRAGRCSFVVYGGLGALGNVQVLIELRVRRAARRAVPAPHEPRATSASGSSDRRPTSSRDCSATLEPLETAANAAWWDANVDARATRPSAAAPTPTSRCPTRSPIPTPSRRVPRRAAESRARPVGRASARRSSSSASRRTRSRPTCAARSSSCRATSSRASPGTAARSTATRSTTTRSSTSCASSDDTRAPSRGVGQPRRAWARRSRPTCASSSGSATAPPASLGLPRPLRAHARDDRLRRGPAVRDARRGRRHHRRAVPHDEGRARRAARGALRGPRRRRCAHGTTTIRSSRTRRARSASTSTRTCGGADLEELTVRTFDGMGLDVRGVVARSDLDPRPGKVQHAFCIDVDRDGDVRVLSNNVAERALGRDDAARVRPRRVLRRRRTRPSVAAADDAPLPHRGRRDALRAPRARPGMVAADRRRSGATVAELAPAAARREPRATARSSPAGCS